MLSAKNIQCMRSLLSMAHCHGKILGTGWNMVLRTLQHLTWILGLVPTDNGQLVPSPSADGANVVGVTDHNSQPLQSELNCSLND